MIGALLVALVAASTSGCVMLRSATYFMRERVVPMQAWEARMDPSAPRDCLLVLLPGLFDLPDEYLSSGFVEDAARASSRCDLVAVDSHVGYFWEGEVADRIDQDILTVAESRGYHEIWLVGISLGALAALMVAREHPDRVRGVVLLSPWLGDETVFRAAMDAGGLRAWTPPELAPDARGMAADTTRVLAWLREHGDNPAIYLGIATDDRWGAMGELVSEVVPADHVVRVPGNHDWAAWRAMWRRLLRDPPWRL